MTVPESTVLAVRVHPRSSKNRHAWTDDGELHIWVTAPAVEGAANKAVINYLADALDLPASRIAFVSGETSRSKRLRVPLSESHVTARLSDRSQ
jgi:uncharacterized protein (TIGR00251 family)